MIDPVNNLWVVIAALLVFTMTISVGLLEIGELGEGYNNSLLKTILMTGSALFFMAFVGFNTAFAPTLYGIIGNPLYAGGLFLGGFSSSVQGLLTGVWWSTAPASASCASCFGTNLMTGSYFLFEAAFASVTFALVGVIMLKKVRTKAMLIYSAVYFMLIWNLPAAWIWNPSGWLYQLGMRDFAGGLVVHGAAGAAGLGIVAEIWREEKARGLKQAEAVPFRVNPGWLTLSILLLWVGWFGFNPGSVLAFNGAALVVVLTTFLAAASSLLSLMVVQSFRQENEAWLLRATDGILMGLIVITPLAGFVSPASAVILGLMAGPLYLAGEVWFDKLKWVSDPVGLLPGHLLGGVFGVAMIAFFTQSSFATAAGTASLPNGLLFGGGTAALQQLGTEVFGIAVVFVVVFALSYVTMRAIASGLHGIAPRAGPEP